MTDAELHEIHAAAMHVPRPWSAAELGALRQLPGVVEASREEGFALARITLDEAELLTLAVRPEARGKGIGTALLEAVQDAARDAGAARMFLEVAETNAVARRLYDRAGYRGIGRRPGYYIEAGPPADAIVMARDL